MRSSLKELITTLTFVQGYIEQISLKKWNNVAFDAVILEFAEYKKDKQQLQDLLSTLKKTERKVEKCTALMNQYSATLKSLQEEDAFLRTEWKMIEAFKKALLTSYLTSLSTLFTREAAQDLWDQQNRDQLEMGLKWSFKYERKIADHQIRTANEIKETSLLLNGLERDINKMNDHKGVTDALLAGHTAMYWRSMEKALIVLTDITRLDLQDCFSAKEERVIFQLMNLLKMVLRGKNKDSIEAAVTKANAPQIRVRARSCSFFKRTVLNKSEERPVLGQRLIP